MTAAITLIQADITQQKVDAVVNAANAALLGGGGVDGAIHRAAGPQLLAECRLLGGCLTGAAKITGGYDLPATHVIHTVGPVWQGGSSGEAEDLANCYRNSLALAAEHKLVSVAFPAISTGVYGYPKPEATAIGIGTVLDFLAHGDQLQEVRLVCFSAGDYATYAAELERLGIGVVAPY